MSEDGWNWQALLLNLCFPLIPYSSASLFTFLDKLENWKTPWTSSCTFQSESFISQILLHRSAFHHPHATRWVHTLGLWGATFTSILQQIWHLPLTEKTLSVLQASFMCQNMEEEEAGPSKVLSFFFLSSIWSFLMHAVIPAQGSRNFIFSSSAS